MRILMLKFTNKIAQENVSIMVKKNESGHIEYREPKSYNVLVSGCLHQVDNFLARPIERENVKVHNRKLLKDAAQLSMNKNQRENVCKCITQCNPGFRSNHYQIFKDKL